MASSEPKTILADINAIKEYLPVEGNPVYLFPTDTTNFARIQTDLNVMLASTEKISAVPRDSSAFHTGMMDLSLRAEIHSPIHVCKHFKYYFYLFLDCSNNWNICYS